MSRVGAWTVLDLLMKRLTDRGPPRKYIYLTLPLSGNAGCSFDVDAPGMALYWP
jgi:hypothetical protein